MKTNIITFLVLLYVLLGTTYSFLPTFAQTTEPAAVEPPATEQQSISDIIISLLDQSNSQVEQQIQQLESQGIEIPPDVNTIFEEGVAEYQTTIESLENGDIENGKEHALEALSLFEDALEELFEAEGDIAEAQEDFAEDFFELQGSITELETEANEIRELVEINNLNINFDNFDTLIDEAIENLANGDLLESEQQIDLADDFLDDVLDQIENEIEEEQDERLNEFVEDTVEELEDIIKEANEAGISSSLIAQLENIVNDLQNAENPSDIFSITEANSDLEDILSQFQDLVSETGDEIEDEIEEEAEDEVEEAEEAEKEAEDEVEDDFEDEVEEEAEDEVEDDFEDEVEEEAEDEVEDDFEDEVEGDFEDDPSSSDSSDSSGSDDDDDDSGSDSSDSSGSDDDDDDSGSGSSGSDG